MSSPFVPCSFTYGDLPAGGTVAPIIIEARNPSNTIDTQYSSGYFWLSDKSLRNSAGNPGSGNLYYQAGNTLGVPNWTLVGSSGSVLSTISDGTTSVNPINSNIAIIGTANQVTVTASASLHQLAISIPSAFIAPGSITATLGDITATNGNLSLGTAGNKIMIATGANASIGTSAALVAGTLVVANTSIKSTSFVFFATHTLGTVTVPQSYRISARTANVSFTIQSSDATDTSTVDYWIIN